MFTQSCCYFKNSSCIFEGLEKIHRFLIYLWLISHYFVDLKKICRFSIFLWIWKRFTNLNNFCGFDKDLTISNQFVDLKKIWRFLINLRVCKRFDNFLLICGFEDFSVWNVFCESIWKRFIYSKNCCGYEKYFLIWKVWWPRNAKFFGKQK